MINPIRERLTQGKPSVGSWLNLASPLAAEVMASIGVPWLVVDAEHSAFDLDLIAHTFRAIEARGATPMARVWNHDITTLSRLLDAGAWGLVIPHVSTPQQASTLARTMRFPPRGTRSCGSGRCLTFTRGKGYLDSFDDVVLCIPQIEDMEGIDNAEEIANVDGVDIGFLGPGDLALSMGVEQGHADHEQAIQRFREAFARAGKPSGIPVSDAKTARQRIDEGFQLIDISNDMILLRSKVEQEFGEFL